MSTTLSPTPGDHAVPTSSRAASDADATLHRLLGQPVRLSIVRALLETEALSFVELKRLVNATDGNLSMHARKLEDAQVVSCTKGFQGRFPRTEYRLTPTGRTAVERFVEHLLT